LIFRDVSDSAPASFSNALVLPAPPPDRAGLSAIPTARVFHRAFDPDALSGDWHQVIDGPGSWPVRPWWEIDIRSPERLGDIKWCWEANRPANLLRLLRAEITSGSPRLESASYVKSWFEQNPPEHGVNWYSNLEVALRAIGWLEVLALDRSNLGQPLRRELISALYQAGHHLERDLPYTLSTMRNNHLLGDALGLLAIGRSFPGDRAARRWNRVGQRLFEYQVKRQFADGGSSVEDSLSYHRFALEMLEAATLIGTRSTAVVDKMAAASRFLVLLGVLDGPVPQYGDWDEGRVLASSGDPLDLSGSALLGLSLAGAGARAEWRTGFDECAWYAPQGEPATFAPAVVDGSSVGDHIARAAIGPLVAWLKSGGGPSHGHADYTSVSLRRGDDWIIGDPGTGTYNGPIEQRDYFRCSIAHSVVRVNGLDQREPHRVFRWVYSPNGWVGNPVAIHGGVVMWGAHDAYTRLRPGRRVARAVLLRAEAMTVVDWIEGGDDGWYALSIPLGPDVTWDAGVARLPSGVEFLVDLPAEPEETRGQSDEFDGWWSDTYGSMRPSTRLEVKGPLGAPIVWSVRSGEAECVTPVDGCAVQAGDTRVALDWTRAGAALSVSDHGRETVAVLRQR